MKKIITIIFLINLISIPVHAESIKDIEIEGISIGDSALKYFDEELIKMSHTKYHEQTINMFLLQFMTTGL